MSKTELFLDKYKQLEETVRKKFGGAGSVSRLETLPEFRRMSAKIKYCRELRNILQHNPKLNGEWGVEVNDRMISFLDELILMIKKPPRICDNAIGIKDILYAKLGSSVLDTMKIMKQRDISKIPVLDGGCVVGIFSYASVFSYVLANSGLPDYKTVFSDIMSDISIDGDHSKYYRFAKWNVYCSEIQRMFDEAYDNHIRIKLVLLTRDGTRNEKLMGIVTPWELLDTE